MLRTIVIPECYKAKLGIMDTEIAIKKLKDYFQNRLEEELQLIKVSSPVILRKGEGINDNLSGVERVVSFDAFDLEDGEIEIVQSLAKWKRMALARYGFTFGEGLYTDMNAIRRDEVMDNIHSIYVDQWDWEKVIFDEKRTMETLQEEVRKIYKAIVATENYICSKYSNLERILPDRIHFVTTQELENEYPELSPKQREDEIARKHGAVFIIQIGGKLESGEIHDSRSPDYDDCNLNGDIVLWYPVLGRAVEISSMGIRVDPDTLLRQLEISDQLDRVNLAFHRAVLDGQLPSTIGGGIGQSRLCMILLKKAHIGEVQVSVWNNKTIQECFEGNIPLL